MEEVRKKLARMQSLCELPQPRRLQWKINKDTETDIKEAIENIDRLIKDLDLFILRFKSFGREFPKSQNMSPDSFIQLALQLTYYKIHGKLVSTYESASVRRFRLGRVDNIRANTPDAWNGFGQWLVKLKPRTLKRWHFFGKRCSARQTL